MIKVDIEYNGYNGGFFNAMAHHGTVKHHEEKVNKLIQDSNNIDDVMKILQDYFEKEKPKFCTDITVTIDNDKFTISQDITTYEKLAY